MKVLLVIPHVFAPETGSLYSSRSAEKRPQKQAALQKATLENISRHSKSHWIHASLGKGKPIVTRVLASDHQIDLTIRVFTAPGHNLTEPLTGQHSSLEIITVNTQDFTSLPLTASRHALESHAQYDIIGYMEDDILIEDSEFFEKIQYLHDLTESHAFIPHRCEHIPLKGDVVLSGDPDGGRPDLFWDTRESISIAWPLGSRSFYRATNPHSGCYFLGKRQAEAVYQYWHDRNWVSPFQLSGPMEQAASGMLLPVLKVMKPVPSQHRFLRVMHQDTLWRRHAFE